MLLFERQAKADRNNDFVDSRGRRGETEYMLQRMFRGSDFDLPKKIRDYLHTHPVKPGRLYAESRLNRTRYGKPIETTTKYSLLWIEDKGSGRLIRNDSTLLIQDRG
jgi:hypothetical protein